MVTANNELKRTQKKAVMANFKARSQYLRRVLKTGPSEYKAEMMSTTSCHLIISVEN
jgi:hypothetical protein